MALICTAIAVAVVGMMFANTRWIALGAVALLTSRAPLLMLSAIALILIGYLLIRNR